MIISDIPLDDAPRGGGNPSDFMIMKSAPRKEIHEGSAVGRDLGGTLCPA